jgi:hypothetical protein
MMDFLFFPESPLFDFLEPFDLLKMLHFTKAARRAAIPKLKAFQACPQTLSQQLMFDDWVNNPRVTKQNTVFDEMKRKNCGENLAGPLRLGSIQQLADTIRERVVLLRYEKTHDRESSCVALFDGDGAFVAYYELHSEQFYETYVNKDVLRADTSDPSIWMQTTAGFRHSVNQTDDCWEMEDPGLEWLWQEGFWGDVTFSNYALYSLFHGLLSPTEAAMVLTHALSSDTRVIYMYTLAVFENMNNNFQDVPVWMYEDEQEANALEAWKSSLPGV